MPPDTTQVPSSSIRKQLTQVGPVPWRTLPSRRPSSTGRSPAGAKVAVCVGEGGTVLAEVAVEGRGEALKADAEEPVQGLEDVYRQGALQARALVETHAEHHLWGSWLSLGPPPRPPGQPAPGHPG